MRRIIFCLITVAFAFNSKGLVAQDGLYWLPEQSSYKSSGNDWSSFYNLAGIGAGYGTTASDGVGTLGVDAYGGRAPDSLIPQGIDNRLGHYYFGFANKFPTSTSFSSYELNGTKITQGTELDLWFRFEDGGTFNTNDDPINFIGLCADTSGTLQINMETHLGEKILRVRATTTDPVFSAKGDGDQESIFGMYVNYGDYDEANQDVDFHGAGFATNIHWWDIEVPDIPRDRLASIRLGSADGENAEVEALIPESYFDSQGLDPNSVMGYVDEDELPLGQGTNYSFYRTGSRLGDHNLDGVDETLYSYKIYNDQWSSHDIGVGMIAVPEPTHLVVFGLGLVGIGFRRRR